jgi:hypothetical protein
MGKKYQAIQKTTAAAVPPPFKSKPIPPAVAIMPAIDLI